MTDTLLKCHLLQKNFSSPPNKNGGSYRFLHISRTLTSSQRLDLQWLQGFFWRWARDPWIGQWPSVLGLLLELLKKGSSFSVDIAILEGWSQEFITSILQSKGKACLGVMATQRERKSQGRRWTVPALSPSIQLNLKTNIPLDLLVTQVNIFSFLFKLVPIGFLSLQEVPEEPLSASGLSSVK